MTKTLVMESPESLDRQGLAWIIAITEVEGKRGNSLLKRIAADLSDEFVKRYTQKRKTKSITSNIRYDLTNFDEGEIEYNALIFDLMIKTFRTLRNPKATRFCEAVAKQLFSETRSQ